MSTHSRPRPAEPADAEVTYYTRREIEEKAMARAARDPAIAAIHIQMAVRYGELARENTPWRNEGPRLVHG